MKPEMKTILATAVAKWVATCNNEVRDDEADIALEEALTQAGITKPGDDVWYEFDESAEGTTEYAPLLVVVTDADAEDQTFRISVTGTVFRILESGEEEA